MSRERLFGWVVARRLAAYGNSAMSRARVLDEVLPDLIRLQDPLLVAEVAGAIGVSEAIVKARIRSAL